MSTTLGGWSAWHFTATPEATKVFGETLGKLLGVHYKMVAFATQVVNGTNYAFLCEAAASTHPATDYIVVAHVHQPIQGAPHIMGISTVPEMPHNVQGGWQNWNFGMTPRAQAVLTAVTHQLLGVNYKGIAFTTQLVNGTNYEFLCEATVVVPDAVPYVVTLRAHQPIVGEPVHGTITRINPNYGL